MNKGQMRRLGVTIATLVVIMTIGITILGYDNPLIAFILGFIILLVAIFILGGIVYAFHSLVMWIVNGD